MGALAPSARRLRRGGPPDSLRVDQPGPFRAKSPSVYWPPAGSRLFGGLSLPASPRQTPSVPGTRMGVGERGPAPGAATPRLTSLPLRPWRPVHDAARDRHQEDGARPPRDVVSASLGWVATVPGRCGEAGHDDAGKGRQGGPGGGELLCSRIITPAHKISEISDQSMPRPPLQGWYHKGETLASTSGFAMQAKDSRPS